MRYRTTMTTTALAIALLLGPVALPASPPGLVNYQGVLRDSAGAPLDGAHDMVFRFYSADVGGDEILVDRHTAGDSVAVAVTGGLFSVQLGAGSLQDGSGPGTHTSLATVFRDYGDVWLRVEVGGEVLDPRVQVVASAYALNADQVDGKSADEFIDTSSDLQTKFGRLTISSAQPGVGGLRVLAREAAYFEDTDGSGLAYLADGNWGIGAYGSAGGGHFEDSDASGYADVARGDVGIEGYGNSTGGYFEDLDGGGFAYVANGNWGVGAYGDSGGGYFEDTNGSGICRAGYGDYGLSAQGSVAGGVFNLDGTQAGAFIANDYYGVNAYGDTEPSSGVTGGGVRGTDLNYGTYGVVAYWGTTIGGNGSKSFVQNHPDDADRVIVYNSLEGDEVGTYTRGTGRLVDGKAAVPLGETFKWVTNPDIGLTVQVTPRGEPVALSVESVSTEQVIVRGPAGSDTVFDFVVHGLRIGFEKTGRVRPKAMESFIPSMKGFDALYEREPELRRFNSLERFKKMAAETRGDEDFDFSRAANLKAAIQEYDREAHGPVDRLRGLERPRVNNASTNDPTDRSAERRAGRTASGGDEPRIAADVPRDANTETASVAGGATIPPDGDPLPAGGPVAPAEVVGLDPAQPGKAVASTRLADPGVIGVATGTSEDGDKVYVVTSGIVECKVDAGYGAIRAGNLLTASPTRGHAMRALETIPGTILGKALEPQDVGTGTIRVLVMPR